MRSAGAWLVAAPLVLAMQSAFAQAVPDAAQLERQQRDAQRALDERERLLSPSGPVLKLPEPPVPSATTAGVAFQLTAVDFPPSAFLTKAELDAYAAPLVGTRVDFAALQRLVETINEAYRAKGQYLARAMLPPQTVREGRVTIALVEARAGAVTINGLDRLDRSWTEAWLLPKAGETIDVPGFDANVARFMKATDSEVVVELVPGDAQGLSNFTMNVKEPKALTLRAYVGNEGNELTGRGQVGFDARFYSLAGRGDRLSLNLLHSEGANTLAAGYTLPINQRGGVISATLSRGDSEIIKGPFAALGVEGESSSLGLQVRQPFWQSGPWQFDALGGVNRYESENTIGGFSTGETRTKTAQAGVGFAYRAAKTEISGSVQSMYARATASSGATLPGRAINFDLVLIQRFENSTALAVQFRGQDSRSGSLPSLIQMSLGGPGSARGYTPGALLGDGGYSASVDYYLRLSDAGTINLFADTALARLTGGQNRRISSAGVGTDWQFNQKVSLTATLSYALDPGFVTSGRTHVGARVSYAF